MTQRIVIPGFRKIETSGGGGEGGTTNYNELTNKPSINNVPLVGNLNTVNLKLTDATLTEEGVPAEAKTVGDKLEEHSTSLTALSEQLGDHTVKSNVPENAVFTDTVYDDTEVKGSIAELNSNLDTLEFGEVAGGKNVLNYDDLVNGDYDFTNKTIRVTVDFDKRLFVKSGTSIAFSFTPTSKVNRIWAVVVDENNTILEYLIVGENKNAIANITKDGYLTPIFGGIKSSGDWIYITLNDVIECKPQIEFNNVITDYEPYIPSVKMLAEEVSVQNESLSDYGLTNVFDGVWEQGGYNGSTGEKYSDTIAIRSVTPISVKSGSLCSMKANSTIKTARWVFFNGSTFVGTDVGFVVKAPSNSTTAYFHVIKVDDGAITPQTVGEVNVYINNAIEEIKNDLGGLSFSVSGTTLSITDGTNTWTLEANS